VWIREQVLSGVAAPAAGPSAARVPEPVAPPPPAPVEVEEKPPSMDEGSAPDEREPDPFDDALAAAQGGRLDEAIAILSGELKRERSGRGRFQRRMQLAHLLMAGGHEQIAYPILLSLADEIDRRGLEDWEPGDVLAHPLTLLWKCAASFNGDEEKRQGIYARICRLDPHKALHCLE